MVPLPENPESIKRRNRICNSAQRVGRIPLEISGDGERAASAGFSRTCWCLVAARAVPWFDQFASSLGYALGSRNHPPAPAGAVAAGDHEASAS